FSSVLRRPSLLLGGGAMPTTLSNSLQNSLGVFWLFCAAMNAGFALYFARTARKPTVAMVWLGVTGAYLLMAFLFFGHFGVVLPKVFREGIDALMGPIVYTTLSVVGFAAVLIWRRFFTNPQVAWTALNLSFLFGGWAMTDPEFFKIIAKPANVPIPMLIYSVGFFTWLALYQAVQNDDRIARGDPPREKTEDEKVLVWPDLVYTELI